MINSLCDIHAQKYFAKIFTFNKKEISYMRIKYFFLKFLLIHNHRFNNSLLFYFYNYIDKTLY